MTTILDRFVVRRGTAADLASVNEIPLLGEWVLEYDTGRLKMGDGTTHYNSLPYEVPGGYDLSALSDGYVIAWNATSGLFEMVPQSGGGGGSRVLMGSVTVAGSATGTMQVTGLDLATHKEYLLRVRAKNATASSMYCYLQFNGDTTLTNYYSAQIVSNASAGSDNSPRAFALEPSVNAEMMGELIRDADGRPTAFTRSRGNAISTPSERNFTIQRNNTANVASIEIVAGSGAAFDIGSSFEVWRY